jgi:hypothetical protein
MNGSDHPSDQVHLIRNAESVNDFQFTWYTIFTKYSVVSSGNLSSTLIQTPTCLFSSSAILGRKSDSQSFLPFSLMRWSRNPVPKFSCISNSFLSLSTSCSTIW